MVKREIQPRPYRVLRPRPEQINSGICACGCGGRTPLSRLSSRRDGHFKDFPLRYIHGHNPRGRRAHGWKGGRIRDKKGYWLVWRPGHHLAEKSGYVRENRLVWEEANGRALQPGEDVHHDNRDRGDNSPANLEALVKQEHGRLHAGDPNHRRKISEGLKRSWADPAIRAKRIQSHADQSSPAARQKNSEGVKRAWADPDKRKRMLDNRKLRG